MDSGKKSEFMGICVDYTSLLNLLCTPQRVPARYHYEREMVCDRRVCRTLVFLLFYWVFFLFAVTNGLVCLISNITETS